MSTMSNNNGFATRSLIALLITLSILPIAVSILSYCANLKQDYDLLNSEIAFMDLRRIMLISYDIEINQYGINFIYQNKDYQVSLVNDKILLQPGTQIIVDKVKKCLFYEANDSIYLKYTDYDDNEYERNIGSAKRFYIDDFSFDDDKLSDTYNSDE